MTIGSGTKIDVREYPEFASSHIVGSTLVPLSRLLQASASWDPAAPLLLICSSGRRAELARKQLAAQGFTSLSILEGGLDAWQAAGGPIQSLHTPPWSIERQVRIAAGSLVLLTLISAHFFSLYLLLGTALIGAGLVFAGVSDTCMMGSVLARLPWNRPRRSIP